MLVFVNLIINTLCMPNFRFRQNSTELDERVAGSRKSRAVQTITQFGAMALTGFTADKLRGDPIIAAWFTSLAMTGLSVRLGLERGSAMRRHTDRILSQEMGVAELGLTETERTRGRIRYQRLAIVEPLFITSLSMWTGTEEAWKHQYGSYWGPWASDGVTVPIIAAAGIASVKLSEMAGKTLDTSPILHRVAHL